MSGSNADEKCDVCRHLGIDKDAVYDAKTKMGVWALLCEAHFIRVGVKTSAHKLEKESCSGSR